MLTGIRKSDGSKVVADHSPKSSIETYYCDYCGSELVHHKSEARIKIGHFKHKAQRTDCPNNSNESELHLKVKLAIYDYIDETNQYVNLELEKWICNKTIRPDVYCESKEGQRIAIEVQASSLTIDTIQKRTLKYYKEGVYVLWVLPFAKRRFIYSDPFIKEPWAHRDLKDKVKLKEFESFILKAYENQLIFWDLDMEVSCSFIIIKMGQYRQPDSQYWKDGEEYFHEGKIAKTIWTPGRKHYDVELMDFEFCNLHSEHVRGKDYVIPHRLILRY